MKKIMLTIGALAVSLLMISTATAVPNTQSTPVMNAVNNLEKTEKILYSKIGDIQPTGFIDFLIQLIILLIKLVMTIVTIIQSVLGIVNLIKNIIAAIQSLVNLIQQLIDLISGGPNYITS
ncbi:MAG: hypothetical protein DRN12_03260 [Thermoplasmata archaeon]|nr:MAG: hypothetical protein DRN12_03260 [Thermoplasmata archaeon]